jgi:hypothetical protein
MALEMVDLPPFDLEVTPYYDITTGLGSLTITADQENSSNILLFLEFLGFKKYPIAKKVENIPSDRFRYFFQEQYEFLLDISDTVSQVAGCDLNMMISSILMKRCR